MAFDSEFRKKVQLFLAAAILISGARTVYIVYERHAERKPAEQPKQEKGLDPDYYVTPRKLHPYDLKSARELSRQPVWVQVGYSSTYYPFNPARHKVDFAHEAGTLGPLQKLQITDVISDLSPKSPGEKQVLALFKLDEKPYAVPIGVEKDGDYQIYSDQMFFIQDPHELYKHWSADVWNAIENHQVRPGMNELQADFAVGMGIPEGSGSDRTVKYPNDGKPLVVTYKDGKATQVKPES
jgi:hypothetical protein